MTAKTTNPNPALRFYRALAASQMNCDCIAIIEQTAKLLDMLRAFTHSHTAGSLDKAIAAAGYTRTGSYRNTAAAMLADAAGVLWPLQQFADLMDNAAFTLDPNDLERKTA